MTKHTYPGALHPDSEIPPHDASAEASASTPAVGLKSGTETIVSIDPPGGRGRPTAWVSAVIDVNYSPVGIPPLIHKRAYGGDRLGALRVLRAQYLREIALHEKHVQLIEAAIKSIRPDASLETLPQDLPFMDEKGG